MTIHHNTAVQDNGINPDWPRVRYCLRHPNRTLYSKLLDNISSKRSHELASSLFQTVRAGLIEGKSPDELRAEISPLIKGYRLSESETYVGIQIQKVIGWLKKGGTSTPPPAKERPKPNGSKSSGFKPSLSSSRASTLVVKERSQRARLIRDRVEMTKINNAEKLVLNYSYNHVDGSGTYCVTCRSTGEEICKKIPAATHRHFQIRMLQGIFNEIVPIGNVILECDDTDLVEHFNLKNWATYRGDGWKGPNGDRLAFIPLYESLDQTYAGRDVWIGLSADSTALSEKSL